MSTSVAGAIIAGGKSSRFGDINKARALLGGKPLIKHVFERLEPQVTRVYLNCPSDFAAAVQTESPLITADYLPNRIGPLNGVLGVLEKAVEEGYDWLLIAPCDTPFLPLDLAAILMQSAQEHQLELAIPTYQGIPQASLSLWHARLLAPLKKAVVEQGAEGFRQFYPHCLHKLVEWPQADYDPFINVNYQSDLSEATEIFNRLGNERPK